MAAAALAVLPMAGDAVSSLLGSVAGGASQAAGGAQDFLQQKAQGLTGGIL